jgi:hypothetical protein
MKIRLTCNWCDDKTLVERFNRAYISKHNPVGHIFTYCDDFDFLVIINATNQKFNISRERTLGVIMEPEAIGSFKYFLEPLCHRIFYHKKQSSMQYIYYPGLLPLHMDYKSGNDLDFYIDTTFKKTKKCSLITSYKKTEKFNLIKSIYYNDPSIRILYSKRVKFVKMILKSDLNIDIFGRGWEQSGLNDPRIKGTLDNKKDGLLDYEFSIAMENCVERDYFTEKLTDCVLTDATPIYYGCLQIDRFFQNVYQLSSLDDLDELKKILKLPPLSQTGNKYLMAGKFNLYEAISKFIAQTPV